MKVNVTNYIAIETYKNEDEFFKSVGGSDLCFKSKEEIIKALNDGKSVDTPNLSVYYLKLKGNTVLKLRDEIISELKNIKEHFKWIRLYYENIELDEEDEKDFEAYKRVGFPSFK